MSKTKVRSKKSDKKTRAEIASEKEKEAYLRDVEKVKKLLIKHKAEDLSEMLLSGAEDYKTITGGMNHLNGRK